MVKRIINKLRKLSYVKKFKAFGDNSRVDPPLRLLGEEYIEIGNNSSIMGGVRAEAIDKYQNQVFEPLLRIGDRTGLGQNCHLIATSKLIIGNEVTISGNVFISTCSHQYTEIDNNVSNQRLVSEDVIIGDYSFVGYGAAIFPGVKLGRQCIVGANSVVVKGDYPDYSVLVGSPAKIIKEYDPDLKEWIRCKNTVYQK